MEVPKNMHPKLWNIDEILSDNYRFLYLNQKDYRTQFIDTENIKLERFKFNSYNYPSLFQNIKHIAKFEFPITKKNKIEVNQFKRKGEIYNCILEIVKYPDNNSVTDITHPINVNQIFKTLLSEFLIKDRTRNIIIPIINTDISGLELKKYIKELQIDESAMYSVQVIEKYGKIVRLSDFMASNKNLDISVIKYILYQVIDCITKINETYPGFHYNNMDFDSLDCYIINHENIYVPEIKLSYFYFSEIEKIIKNKAVNEIGMQYYNVPYCDIFYFFKDFVRLYFERIENNEDAVKFFDKYYPKRIRDEEYFTEETWNKLTDTEKSYLNIRSIRNDEFLSIKEFINKIESSRLNKNFSEIKRLSKHDFVPETDNYSSDLEETIKETDISDDSGSDIMSLNRLLADDKIEFSDDEEEPEFFSINEKYNKISNNKLSDNNIKNMATSNVHSGKRFLNKNKSGKLKRNPGLDVDLDIPPFSSHDTSSTNKSRNKIADLFGVDRPPKNDLARNYEQHMMQRNYEPDQRQMQDMSQKYLEMMGNPYSQNNQMGNPMANPMLMQQPGGIQPQQMMNQFPQFPPQFPQQQQMLGGNNSPFFFQR